MKKMIRILLIAVPVVIFCLDAGEAGAAKLVVDPNGGADFKTIQEAIDTAWDYDTIEVCPGVYREHIDYHGVMVTIRSADANDPVIVESTIIDGGGTGNVVMFHNSEGPYSVLQGLTIRNGQNGIECTGADTSPWIDRCSVVSNTVGIACSLAEPYITETIIENNKSVGISASLGETSLCRICSNGTGKDGNAGLSNCRGLVSGCVISGNNGDGVCEHIGDVKNCLISANLRHGLYFHMLYQRCNITNCTIVGNKADGISFAPISEMNFAIRNSVVVLNGGFAVSLYYTWGEMRIDYSDTWGNIAGDWGGSAPQYIKRGAHLISLDPFFAKRGYWDASMVWHEGEYHLKSKLGRWDTRTLAWVTDPEDSPCLDRGDPNDGFGDEPYPHGGRINMGAYGGTAEASKSEGPKPLCIKFPVMDFNHDCKVDQADLDIFTQSWLQCNLDPPEACLAQ